MPWFRFYTRFRTDPAVQMLAFEDQRHFTIAMCLKGEGILDKEYPTEQVRSRVICVALGLDAAAAGEANRRLREAGLVDAQWQPLAWDKNQFVSDHNAADRKRAERQRKRDMSQDVTATRRDSHGLDTDTEVDTEEEPTLLTSNQDLLLEADASLGPTPQTSSQPEAEPERTRAKTAKTPKTASGDARGTRLGDFPLTPERWKFAEQQGIADPKRTHTMFCNYWRAKSGREARKVDWDATWQNWCIKDGEEQRNRRTFAKPSAPAQRVNPYRSTEFPS